MSRNKKKRLMEEYLHIYGLTRAISIKVIGKMCLMIKFSLEKTHLLKPQEVTMTALQAFLGLIKFTLSKSLLLF